MYRREVLRTPVRTLAVEIGISKSAVDRFYKVRSHPGKNWPKLRDWYMRTRQSKTDEYQTPPELMLASALQTLTGLPENRRISALQATVEHYQRLYAGLPTPDWVQMLADVAEREALS